MMGPIFTEIYLPFSEYRWTTRSCASQEEAVRFEDKDVSTFFYHPDLLASRRTNNTDEYQPSPPIE